MAIFKPSKLSILEMASRSVAKALCMASAITPIACVRHVWSDQVERFRLERQASFAPYQKVDTVERRVHELSSQQLEELKKLRWTGQGRCWEDVSFFYTVTVYDRNGKEETFHAPDWNCGPSEGKRYIEEVPMHEFFQSLAK